MIKGQLIINGKDAYTEWGITMDSTALSTLMTPPAMKEYITNESRLDDGSSIVIGYTRTNDDGEKEEITTPKVASRDITVQFNLVAPNENAFLTRYWSFCKELQKGSLDISTSFLEGVVFHMVYESCTQFSEYNLGIAKFALKLTEPNPKNRS